MQIFLVMRSFLWAELFGSIFLVQSCLSSSASASFNIASSFPFLKKVMKEDWRLLIPQKYLQEIVLRKGEISNNFEVVKEDFELVSSSSIVSPTDEPPSDEKPRNWRCSSQLKFSSWSKFVFNFGNTWLSPSSCTPGSYPCPFSGQSQWPRTSQGQCCTWLAPGFT